jgi:hypothetical protein
MIGDHDRSFRVDVIASAECAGRGCNLGLLALGTQGLRDLGILGP